VHINGGLLLAYIYALYRNALREIWWDRTLQLSQVRSP